MNLKLLYSEKEIRKYLKPLMNIDIYDDLTINHYEKKYLTDLTENDLEVMLDTIEDQSVSFNSSQSLGISAYNALITIFSIVSTIGITVMVMLIGFLLNNGESSSLVNFGDLIYAILSLLLVLLLIISYFYISSIFKMAKIEKVKKTIKILMDIKNKNDK